MLHEETTQVIIKAFYTVYNTLGHGFLEKVYENALVYELDFIKICFDFRTAFCVSAKFGSYAARNMFP